MTWEPRLDFEPTPQDYAEQMRWEETRLRARILEETHRQDLLNRQIAQYGPARAKIIGTPDQSVNFLKGTCRQLSVLYMDRGSMAHPSGPYPELLGEDVPDPTAEGETIRQPGFIEKAGFWSIMGRVQMWTLGLNEMLVHPCIVDAETNPRVVYRVVNPACVTAIADYEDPTRPAALRWLTKRRDRETGKVGWTWDEWDIQDKDRPFYRIVAVNPDGKDGEDVTLRVLTPEAADYDQWRKADGTPLIPWTVYHKQWPTGLWDPYDWKAAVEGTMMLSIDWAYAEHCFQDAAFPQRWSMGCGVRPDYVEPQSGTSPATAHVVVDPTRVIRFDPDDNATNPQVGQFEPGADVTTLGEYLAARTAQLGQQMGVDASDLVRTSGDPRSGYALAISQEAKRQAQVTYKPQFERSDKELIALTATLLNRATGSSFPEDGYSIDYADVTAPGLEGDGGTAAPLQDTVLNGAQVTAAVQIVSDVAAGLLPRESGVALLVAASLAEDEAEANAIMSTAGAGFVQTPKTPPPTPFAPAPPEQESDQPAAAK